MCNSADLVNGGRAVPFDIVYAGQTCRAFAIRYQGQVHAYLNRCTHVAMEMDYQPDRFFDDTGPLVDVCHTWRHLPARYGGLARVGPCRGGLVKIDLSERGRCGSLAYCLQLKTLEF